MTNYKQLCADLVAWAEKTSAHYYSEPGVLIRARATLAKPEPEGPTDEELLQVFDIVCLSEGGTVDEIHLRGLRAILARWGNHPANPDSSLQPIPVSERMPEPEDCNSEGKAMRPQQQQENN